MPNNCYLNRNFNRYASPRNRCGGTNTCGNCNTCENYDNCPDRGSLRNGNYDARDSFDTRDTFDTRDIRDTRSTCDTCDTCGTRNSCDTCDTRNSCDVCERQQLLDDIRAYAFAIIDIGLYLDTNPECEFALEYYNTYRDLHREAVALYEANYGPLSIYGNEDDDRWKWNCAPWPWEGGDC